MRRILKRPHLSLVAPLLVIGLAFFLRVYRLPDVPFGWHPDEATKGLLAQDVLAAKSFPAFFSAFTGREALYVYLEAGAIALLGKGVLAGRLLSACIGVLTVAATYALGAEMFKRRVGLLGAAFMAVSLWHLVASRNGYRAVIQPLVQIPVLWFLFRGWRTGGRRDFLVAGFFLGLTQYTYTAVRAFPLLVAAVLLLALLIERSLVVRHWRWLALMCLLASLVFLPLGWHFYQHPVDLTGRAAQISVFAPEWSGGDPWGRLGQSLKETAGMFTDWGDPNFRFNLSGRPVFGTLDGLLFYVGVVLCLYFVVKPPPQLPSARRERESNLPPAKRGGSEGGAIFEKELRRLAYLSLPVWMIVMLLPMTLSAEGLPYYQRAIGILPALYFFPALALDALVTRAERSQSTNLPVTNLLKLLIILLFIWLTARTYQEYFHDWHQNPRNDDDRRVAMVYVADYLKENEPPGELYLSTEYPQHPTLAFLAPERYDGIHWFDARQSLPLPPQGVEATYLLLLENPPQPALLSRASDLQPVETHLDRFGRPVFEVYHWPGGPPPTPSDRSPAVWSWEVTFEPGDPQGLRHPIELPVNLGDTLEFLGHDRSAQAVSAGETLDVILYWRLLERPGRHYSIFAHLLDAKGQIVGEHDANRYPTLFWREGGGETLLGHFPLQVKPGTTPGEYQLEIGVYHQPTGERLPVLQEGDMVADRLLLQTVEVR